MSNPPGIPICLSCAKDKELDKDKFVRIPSGPMDGPWRDDGSVPPHYETCTTCGGTTIAGLYLKETP